MNIRYGVYFNIEIFRLVFFSYFVNTQNMQYPIILIYFQTNVLCISSEPNPSIRSVISFIFSLKPYKFRVPFNLQILFSMYSNVRNSSASEY